MLEMLLGSGGPYVPFELTPLKDFYWTNDYVQRLRNVRDWSWGDMGNTFHFTNRNNGRESGIRVWRHTEPFDMNSLPAEPHLVLPPGATSFTDPDAPRGSRFWYLLEVYKGPLDREFTGPFEATALGINVGPGPQNLVAGTPGAGFFGETTAAELISGPDLATLIGLTVGSAQNSTEPWLKFALDGKILFVARKTFRHSISWNQIHARGAVFGTRTVVIQGDTYKVRLLKGANSNPANVTNVSWDHPGTHGSEWNRLMYRISGKPFSNASNTLASEGIAEGDWAQYSEAALNIAVGNGRYSWCQETPISNSANRVVRGYNGVSNLNLDSASASTSNYGWRPCLELVD